MRSSETHLLPISLRGLLLFAVVFCITLSGTACRGPGPPGRSALLVDSNPFSSLEQIPMESAIPNPEREPLPKKPSRFCVDHLSSQVDLPEDDDRLPTFERLLAAELRSAGFEVVGAEELNETWDRIFEEAGDLFDRHTGERNVELFESTRIAALAALHSEHGCDFMMTPQILLVSAAWYLGDVQWDGAFYTFTEGLLPGSNSYGYVGALSLHIRIQDLDGELVYFGTGGIQPTSELIGGFTRDEFKAIPVKELLRSEVRNRRAIQLAIGQMSNARPSADGGENGG